MLKELKTINRQQIKTTKVFDIKLRLWVRTWAAQQVNQCAQKEEDVTEAAIAAARMKGFLRCLEWELRMYGQTQSRGWALGAARAIDQYCI